MGNKTGGVVVVGCGYWGKNLIRCFHGLGALHGVCDASEAAMDAQKALYPAVLAYRDLVAIAADSEVTSVALATPAELHFAQIMALLQAGKDVFVEKPLALDAHEAREAIAFAQANDRILMAGHLLEYHPAFAALREATREGALGELRYLVSNRLSLGKVRSCENVWWSFAPHDISMLCALANATPSTVALQGTAWLQPDIVDTASAQLTWDSGLVGRINVSWAHPFKEHRLVAVGTKNSATFDDTLPQDKVQLSNSGITIDGFSNPITRDASEPLPYTPGEPLTAECAHFLEACHTRQAPLTGGMAALRVVAVLQAGQQSLQDGGTPVAVAPFMKEAAA